MNIKQLYTNTEPYKQCCDSVQYIFRNLSPSVLEVSDVGSNEWHDVSFSEIIDPECCYRLKKLWESAPNEPLHVLRERDDWWWIKWEWFDKRNNRNYIWYEFPGGIVKGDIPDTGQNLREYNESPPMPTLVRWKSK